ncbi:MAG: retroviral-like aspartic protease family protein [Planctomycetota bacterium]
MNARNAARGPRRWLVVLLVITVVIGLANLFGVLKWMGARDDGRGVGGEELQQQKNAEQNSKARDSAKRDKPDDAAAKPAASVDADRPRIKLSFGWLVVEDSWGRRLASLPLAVTADGWMAAPRRFLIGGTKWKLEIEGRVDALENGLYRVGDSAALWQLAEGPLTASARAALPQLEVWDGGEVEFIEYRRDAEPVSLRPRVASREGYFTRADVEVATSGALVQDGAIVGWVFLVGTDPVEVVAWLYRGPTGERLTAELTIEEFYELTFAGGREEAQAIALREVDATSRLKALIASFARASRLELEETPAHLRPEAVLRVLLADASQLVERDRSALAELLTERVIQAVADGTLLYYAVASWANAYGADAAVQLEGRWRAELIERGSETERQLDLLLVRLYARWLYDLMNAGDWPRAWQVYASAAAIYPDDADIALRGIELTLHENQWQQADRLLGARAWPAEFADRVGLLKARVSELKGQQGKIVLRFQPGSSSIPARAVLNGRVAQDYIVDTGATITTIPYSAALALGIRITAQMRRLEVRTASGVVLAPDITLDSISLGGWEVRNVRVLVHDLPEQPGLGLLGLNFLQSFRVDLDSERGVLTLEPK